MAARRDDILDAAIALLGEQGMHRLTHRGVDTAAGVPAGSTSNYFRTRQALIGGVVERFAARERANLDAIVAAAYPTTPKEVSEMLAAFAIGAVGPHRTVSLARYAILIEAAIHPSLQEQVSGPSHRVRAWGTAWMRAIGSSEPERDARIVWAHIDGLVLHQLANPDPDFDPTDRITALIEGLLSRSDR